MNSINLTPWIKVIVLLTIVAVLFRAQIRKKVGGIPRPSFKWDVKWLRPIGALAVWVVIVLTAHEFFRPLWNEFWSRGWYAKIILLAATVLFCYIFGWKFSIGSGGGTASGHKGEGFKGFAYATIGLYFLLSLLLLVAGVIRYWPTFWGPSTIPIESGGNAIPRHFKLYVEPGKETRGIWVPDKWEINCELHDPTAKVWVRTDRGFRALYSRGMKLDVGNLSWIYFEGYEDETVVTVDIHPRPTAGTAAHL